MAPVILHLSIEAADPPHVAAVLAEVMGGRPLPFPPFPDSWIAFGADDDGTAVEVYPLGHRLEAGPEMVRCAPGAPAGGATFAHAAIASPLSADTILDVGERERWLSRTCDRGPFACVEMWVENRLLIEWLDAGMAAEYRRGMTMENWAAMFGLIEEEKS